MISKAIALLVVTAGGAYATTELVDQVKPEAERVSAEYSIGLIADAAYLESTLTGDWESALDGAVTTARNNEALTLEGTTLYWRYDDACFYAELPTPDTVVRVQSC